MAARRKTRRTAAQKAATKRMLAGARKARATKTRRRRVSKRLHKYVGTTAHKSTGVMYGPALPPARAGRMHGPALPPGYEYVAVPGGMKSRKKRKASKKKRAKKAAKRKAPRRHAHKTHSHKKRARKGHKTVSAASILKAARKPKIWVCVGRVRTGCGGGKRGGHVMGNIRFQ
jgi:hypothetical protein